MNLKLILPKNKRHDGVVAALSWSKNNELYSSGDDKSVQKWDSYGEFIGKTCDIESYVTCMDWLPNRGKLNRAEIFVVGCADGSYKLVNQNGRVEKSVNAHTGAIVAAKWTHDGSALCTAGEDGKLQLWSRGGSLRNKIASVGKCIYSIAFNATSEKILFCAGKNLNVKMLHSTTKQRQWKAHDGVILKVDWNPLSNYIVSCGEDGFFKIWDKFGRVLYKSSHFQNSITSLAWSPNGEYLAVGSFDLVKLCDRNGFTHVREKIAKIGSPFDIAWTDDSTEFALGGGSGNIVFGKVIQQSLEWNSFVVKHEEVRKIMVLNILNDETEEIDFRDKIVKMSIGFGYLIVVTTSQCFIYNTEHLNSPHVMDCKDITLIVQSGKVFLLSDSSGGICIYSYEGRLLSTPKVNDSKTGFFSKDCITLSNDVLAVVDKSLKRKSKEIRLYSVQTGKELSKPIQHNMKIRSISLSQFGSLKNKTRQIVFVDRNRDLYIANIKRKSKFGEVPYKLATMVDSVCWNDSTNMLIAVSDSKLICWYYPNIIYIDRDLAPLTKNIKKEVNLGKRSTILSFTQARVRIKLWKGSIHHFTVSPHPLVLYSLVEKGKWEEAIRLCRYVKSKAMWACLAAMSVKEFHLKTAEVALASIEQVDKLKFIVHVSSIPSQEGRRAELALYQRRPDDAERILLQSELIFRAVKMNCELYRWERAIELATKYKNPQLLPMVLMYRRRYLEVFSLGNETNPLFQQYQDEKIDEKAIKDEITREDEKESMKPGSGPIQ